MITVIETTTEERHEETKALFEQIKPYLDKGYSYMNALIEIGKVQKHLRSPTYNHGFFKDLKRYGESQGYPYSKYSGKGRCG